MGANVATGCVSELSVNVYGEPLSECRAAATDSSGSWMWDGKCTEEGGGVHQICMDQLPADFSVATGQGPWPQGRANKRHCVCIGAWSLYMTREEDPSWTTSSAWPLCDAIPLSALTSRYVAKWKDWNGIPAKIVLGASKLLRKCLTHRAGPGSATPSLTAACHLAQAFKGLQMVETSLAQVEVQASLIEFGFNCSTEGVASNVASPTNFVPQTKSHKRKSSTALSIGGYRSARDSGSGDGSTISIARPRTATQVYI